MTVRKSESAGGDGSRGGGGEGGLAPERGIGNGQVVSRPSGRVPTMQDIARASGVSQSTVSRVLTGAPTVVPINPATRERVLEVARQLHYRPNPLARGLRGARTMLLGVIVREISDPFFAGAMDAITAEASSRGYNVVLGVAHSRADEAIALRAVLETRHCDALLLLGDLSDQPRLQADLADAHISLVALWQNGPLPNSSSVDVDNRAGERALVDHLWGLGHRSFGFIGASHRPSGVEERLLGDIRERKAALVDRLAELGVAPAPSYFRAVQNGLPGGASALEDLMALPEPPTAIVASTDLLAIGALNAAHRLGVRVPEDVSIVGFDDLAISEFTIPPLTTVSNPVAAMAAVAVPAAIDGVENPELRIERLLPPSLIVRESSGPPPVSRRSRG